MPTGDVGTEDEGELAAWASSGAMWLTGRPEAGGLGPPEPLIGRLAHLADLISERSGRLGRRVEVDPLAHLCQRAAYHGLSRQGATSCGGATRLLAAADGWVAVTLNRPDDVEAVPAWLEGPVPNNGEVWPALEAAVGGRTVAELVERAGWLGLPVAALPAGPQDGGGSDRSLPVARSTVGSRAAPVSLTDLVVVDLSALWAGPVCTRLLADAGAAVVKVESCDRPDGGRRDGTGFFDRLNHGKASVALDLRSTRGRATLERLLTAADVVVESSRPRALEQLGIYADDVLAAQHGPRLWLSITGYGRCGPARQRVAFGDDAAVAGGLVSRDGSGPCFCADAVADPIAGLVAAAACLDALAGPERGLLDVSMAGAAAWCAGPTRPVPPGLVAAAPRRPPAEAAAAPIGADTDRVLRDLGIGP